VITFVKTLGVVYSAFEFEFGFGHVAARDGRRGGNFIQ
jgi:hypothetical protein